MPIGVMANSFIVVKLNGQNKTLKPIKPLAKKRIGFTSRG